MSHSLMTQLAPEKVSVRKDARFNLAIEASFRDVLEEYRRQHTLRSTAEAARELMRLGWAASQA
ncbi:MAG: hypothetical protein RLZZ216_814 [Cyanobacteriota bacterium]|jgi:hypothetical protein